MNFKLSIERTGKDKERERERERRERSRKVKKAIKKREIDIAKTLSVMSLLHVC